MHFMNQEGVISKDDGAYVTDYAVFIYSKGQNISELEGHAPLVFSSADEVFRELKVEGGLWLDDEATIVIRKMKIKHMS